MCLIKTIKSKQEPKKEQFPKITLNCPSNNNLRVFTVKLTDECLKGIYGEYKEESDDSIINLM